MFRYYSGVLWYFLYHIAIFYAVTSRSIGKGNRKTVMAYQILVKSIFITAKVMNKISSYLGLKPLYRKTKYP